MTIQNLQLLDKSEFEAQIDTGRNEMRNDFKKLIVRKCQRVLPAGGTMDVLEIVQRWLAQNGVSVQVDTLPVAPGKTGLFPQGRQVLWEKKDVLGGGKCRARYTFLLRQMAVPGEHTEQKLLFLQEKTQVDFPNIGENQSFRVENGRYAKQAGTGLGIYELRLVAEREENQ